MDNPSLLLSFSFLVIIIFVYPTIRNFYRVHSHPLAKFPGPSEAASSTSWMYKVLKSGSSWEHFDSLHKKYNTQALRIAPNELHITDVHQYKFIYGTRAFTKQPAFYRGFGVPHNIFTEIDPLVHKQRRRMMNPLFTRTSIFRLEPVVQNKVRFLLGEIDALGQGKPVNVYRAFRCVTAEIILEIGLGKSPDLTSFSSESPLIDVFAGVTGNIWTLHQWPILTRIMEVAPLSLVGHFHQGTKYLNDFIVYAENRLKEYYESDQGTKTHPVLCDNLSSLPYKWQVQELMNLIAAGHGTTATTVTYALTQILPNKKIYDNLVHALHSIEPDAGGVLLLSELEKVDYLMACIKESMRCAPAVPGRLPRVVPNNPEHPLIINGKVVPPGTSVSISALAMHYNEEVWGSDVRDFNPDRWMREDTKELDQYLSAFSYGSRMCIGYNLAYAEMLILMGYIFKFYKMSLCPSDQPYRTMDNFVLDYHDPPGVHIVFEPC